MPLFQLRGFAAVCAAVAEQGAVYPVLLVFVFAVAAGDYDTAPRSAGYACVGYTPEGFFDRLKQR